MLIAKEIEGLELVANATSNQYRSSSYDPTIWKIITPDGEEVDSYKLPPMGIVEVISKERFRIPKEICCLAHVKTSLCNEGLLTLNTGIIDPGWNGRVSSFILNFGKDDRLVLQGGVFLRVTFHRMSSLDAQTVLDLPEEDPQSDQSYIADRRRNIVERFAPEFLNLQKIVKSTVAETFDKYRQVLIYYVPVGALLLAFLTFFLNFGILGLVQKWVQPNDAAKSELLRASLERRNDADEKDRKALLERIDRLERALNAISQSSAPPSQHAN
jgi:dUTPase